MPMRISYEAKRVEQPGKPVFWVSNPPRFNCNVNLNELKLLVFPSRQKEGDLTVILDDPRLVRDQSDAENEDAENADTESEP